MSFTDFSQEYNTVVLLLKLNYSYYIVFVLITKYHLPTHQGKNKKDFFLTHA